MMKHVPLFSATLPRDWTELKPGSFFLRKIQGSTGRWVAAGQAFVRGGSNWTHAGLVLDHGQLIQAEPGGARIIQAETLWDDHPVLVSDAPMQRWLAGSTPASFEPGADLVAEEIKRVEIVGKARYLEHVPYSFLDYVVIGLSEIWQDKTGKKVTGWLRNRVEDSQHLICSALVDRAYSWADIHLFDDGRLPGDVTPWDLEQYVLRYEGERLSQRAAEHGPGEQE
jgi:hypothetical protein